MAAPTTLHLLRGAQVYAPEPLGAQDLLFGGGHILALAPRLDAPPPGWPVEEHDCTGLILTPGLIDLHTHLTGGGGEGGAHTRVPPVQLTDLSMAGVTTAVGLLGTDTTTRSLEELLATARGLSHYGLTALCYTGGYRVPPKSLLASVREDIALIDRFIAVGEIAISDHRSGQPTFDELVRIASDAHVAGLMTGKAGLLHLHLGDGPRGLSLVRRALDETELPIRVFHPTHVNRNRRLWDEAVALGRRGLTVDITCFPPEPGTPTAAEDVRAWLDAGNPLEQLTLSSDGGGCLPDFDDQGRMVRMGVGNSSALLDTLRALVHGGMPLGDALRPITSTPAHLLRLHTKGAVGIGADADLLLLDRDLRTWGTVASGRWLVRGGVPLIRGLFAS